MSAEIDYDGLSTGFLEALVEDDDDLAPGTHPILVAVCEEMRLKAAAALVRRRAGGSV